MLIHNKLASSCVNGPGDRAVVWVQGCTLKCAGCWNPDTHAFSTERVESIVSLAEWVCRHAKDGVTFSGGEPLQQMADLWLVIYLIRAWRPELSIGMFTGYTEQELDRGISYYVPQGGRWEGEAAVRYWQCIKRELDFAVMGRYNQLQPSKRPMCGSENQQIVLFSERYKLEDFEQQAVELDFSPEGLVTITGFPEGEVKL